MEIGVEHTLLIYKVFMQERQSKSLLADIVSIRRTTPRQLPIQVLTHKLLLNFEYRQANYFFYLDVMKSRRKMLHHTRLH